MTRLRRVFVGGSAGNEQLTAVVATLLLLLLAIEGATILRVRSLLTVHAFVGMLLIPVLALKLASTGWRMLSYYRGTDEYVRRGPPHVLLRVLVAPVTVLRPSSSSAPASRCSSSDRRRARSSACTRRASSSGSARRASTCWRTSWSSLRRSGRGSRALPFASGSSPLCWRAERCSRS